MATLAAFATSAQAAIVTVPTGLNPGDRYRLFFITSTKTTATDTTAAYYNSFVNGVAQTVPSLVALGTWTVMGNLNGADMWVNTGTTGSDLISIYRLDGTVFAADYTALKAAPAVPVAYNELGNAVVYGPGQEVGRVWTNGQDRSSSPAVVHQAVDTFLG